MPILDVFGATKPVIKIQTQISPDFSINLEPQTGQPTPVDSKPGIANKIADFFVKNIVKPQITIVSNGVPVKKYAPYGAPNSNLGLPLLAGLGIGVVGFSLASYYFCKNS